MTTGWSTTNTDFIGNRRVWLRDRASGQREGLGISIASHLVTFQSWIIERNRSDDVQYKSFRCSDTLNHLESPHRVYLTSHHLPVNGHNLICTEEKILWQRIHNQDFGAAIEDFNL